MTDLIQQAGIQLAAAASSSEEAVASCGQLLFELGAIETEYAAAMWEREQIFSSAIGMGFAIPHGTDESRKFVNFDQLVFLRLENPIMWGDEEVYCVLGIASQGDAHVDILGNLAELIQDPAHLATLMNSNSPSEILDLLLSNQD
ncbi:PTS sugar transporter subunit IIA [Candidatus Aquiluna sp. UB-MaderosW2red]|jgi:mannitol/fructose-specific phosphotransferase system IIA component|uniref:PTS sugar transporter subunit IIA n=1 Tax=Candidatus Aquiluna sp. UB-MaderosW2red TaxID=1855377 RepID=UPI0012FC6B6F|nr:PTS sugar transporter subunit IIA [Candidatus Aquiluna sp. UB-MaderosW2red]